MGELSISLHVSDKDLYPSWTDSLKDQNFQISSLESIICGGRTSDFSRPSYL